ASFDVTVSDDETPTISGMPADITESTDAGVCTAVVTWTEPTAADNCAIDTFTPDMPSGSTFPFGTTTVTYTATDIYANVTTATFNVTVTDNEVPVISGTPTDITQNNDVGLCSGVVSWTLPTAADNCAVDTLTGDAAPGDTFPVGTTAVTYTATDIHGNIATASFNVTVLDAEDPFYQGGGEGYALGPISDASSSTIQENWSGGSGVYFTNDSTDNEEVTNLASFNGANSWYYRDVYGNPGAGSPFTPDLGLAEADLAGQTYVASLMFKAESTVGDGSIHRIYNGSEAGDDRTGFNLLITNAPDGDGGLKVQSYSYSGGSFPLIDLATNLDRNQWHSIEITVTYGDLIDPSLDVYEYSINGGAPQNVPSWVNLWRLDQGFAMAYGERIAFASNATGANNSGFYYDDITYGLAGGGPTLTIGFEEPVSPVTDITTTADPGSCDAVVTWTSPVGEDNCGVISDAPDYTPGTAFPVGTTTVTHTATDAAGNTGTVSFNITVTDDEDPTISGTPADITQTTDAGLCTTAVTWTEPTAADNCPGVSLTSDIASGTTFFLGTTTVTYTATDTSGNSVTSTFNVIVTDNENPTISGTPADITQNTDA
ncbi:MAG: HYR domain-containing protein, partial [Ilumatobacteraceae bacterium]